MSTVSLTAYWGSAALPVRFPLLKEAMDGLLTQIGRVRREQFLPDKPQQ